jgi:hypothetical protein
MFRLRTTRPRAGSADFDLAEKFDALPLDPLGRGYRERFFHVLGSRRRRAAIHWVTSFLLWAIIVVAGVVGFAALLSDMARAQATGLRPVLLLVCAVLAAIAKRHFAPRETFRFHRDVAGELAAEASHYVDLEGAFAGLDREAASHGFAERVEELAVRQAQDWVPDNRSPESVGRLRYRLRHDLPHLPYRLYFYVKAMFYAVAGADNEETSGKQHFTPESADTVERINARAGEIVDERTGLRLWRTLILVSSGFVPIAALLVVPIREQGRIADAHLSLGITFAFAEVFCLIILLFVRRRVALLGAQLQLLEYDFVIASLVAEREKTAANLFFKHQAELKQYYDQTLRQNRQSFVLGIVLVLVGLGSIVAVVALLLASSNSPTAARIAAGGLGAAAALLTGFVARVYLNVYEGSAEALSNFHERLVNTNHFHFANLLVSGVSSDEKRTDALAGLAAAVATQSTSRATGEV